MRKNTSMKTDKYVLLYEQLCYTKYFKEAVFRLILFKENKSVIYRNVTHVF